MQLTRRGVIGAALAAGALPIRALAQQAATTNSIALQDGRLWIAAMVEGKGPYHFVIDTGAFVSLIDDKLAKSLKLEELKGYPIHGVGGIADHGWYQAREVRLASGTRFQNMAFAAIDRPLGEDALGSFGAGLFTTYDSDLDFSQGKWRAYPGGRPDFVGLTRLPSKFTRGVGGASILAEAAIDDFHGTFILDTGAPGDVSLLGRAAQRANLWRDDIPYAPARARGVGAGAVESRIVRAKRLKIGPFVFENPLVTVQRPGTTRPSEHDGWIGLSALSRLNLTTDVSEQAVWARPSGVTPPSRNYPLSGLWLDQRRQQVVVADVGFGSPAASAGLKRGDVIEGALPQLIDRIGGGPGKQISLTVVGGGAKREVRYTLAPWL